MHAVGSTPGINTSLTGGPAGIPLATQTGSRMRRILWSPMNRNQFMVGSMDLRMYEWSQQDNTSMEGENKENKGERVDGGSGSVQLVAVNKEVGSTMKTFAWAKHDTWDDLVAVGQSHGRTVVLRLRPSTQRNSGSPWNHLNETEQDEPIVAEFIPRHSRPCNAVAFSPSHSNLLATGLDKVRNDYCLLLWDIHSPSTGVVGGNGSGRTTSRPFQRASSVVQPLADWSGASGGVEGDSLESPTPLTTPSVSQGRLNSNRSLLMRPSILSTDFQSLPVSSTPSSTTPPTAARPIQQFGSSEAITSLAWFPNHPLLLAAGMGLKWVRCYDLRHDSTQPSVVISSRAVYGLTMDPFHPYRFASFSEEAVVRLWDLRKPSEPLLTLNHYSHAQHAYTQYQQEMKQQQEMKPAGLARIAFHPRRRGLLASLAKDAEVITLWDVQQDVQSTPLQKSGVENVGAGEGLPTSGSIGSLGVHAGGEVDHLVLWRSRITKIGQPIASFVWIPTMDHMLLTLGKNNRMEVIYAYDESVAKLSPNGTLLACDGHAGFCSPISSNNRVTSTTTLEVTEDLMRQRAKDGYGMDPSSNLKLSGLHPSLRGAWEWIQTTQDLQRMNLTSIGSTDYAFDGLISLLQQEKSLSPAFRSSLSSSRGTDVASTAAMAYTTALNNQTTFIPISSSSGRTPKLSASQSPSAGHSGTITSSSPARSVRDDYNGGSAVTGAEELPLFPVYTSPRRSLALHMCGWSVDPFDVDKTIQELTSKSEMIRAAAWALFFGNIHKCIQVLYSSQDEKHRIVATALSGFHAWNIATAEHSSSGKAHSALLPQQLNRWQDMCRIVGADMKDPYLKVMFTFISSGGKLQSLLEETSLPLRERLGVAIRFMTDDDLATYLKQVLNQMVEKGDIQGLILSGINGQGYGFQLIQQFVDRFHDIQSAALLVCFGPIRYYRGSYDDQQLQAAMHMQHWVESYRSLLNKWQLYTQRCQYDIKRRKTAHDSNSFSSSTTTTTAIKPHNSNSLLAASGISNSSSSTGAKKPSTNELQIEEILQSCLNEPPQVYLRCHFCNQSVAHNSLFIPGVGMVGVSSSKEGGGGSKKNLLESHLTSRHASPVTLPLAMASGQSTPTGLMGSVGSTHRAKRMACPSCRKPLPRCVLCLLHMGMPLDGLQAVTEDPQQEGNDKKDLGGMAFWFSWCQTCRHGGHAIHLMQWFSRNVECPVSDCRCQCNNHQ